MAKRLGWVLLAAGLVLSPVAARADCMDREPPTRSELFRGAEVVVVGRVRFLERTERPDPPYENRVDGVFEVLGPAYFKGQRAARKAGGLKISYEVGHIAPGCDFIDDIEDGGLYKFYLGSMGDGRFYVMSKEPLPEPKR